MSKRLFKEGGPYQITRTGSDEYSLNIPLPLDEEGLLGRECPNESCSPGYFKVKLGTGITGGQEEAYCPYCRYKAEPAGFTTQEQLRYAKDAVFREAHRGVNEMIKDAFGLGSSGKKKMGGGFLSIEMSYQPGSLSPVRRPLEEELRRDVSCPHCSLDQAVFGLATWCADCGADIFLTHVEAEYLVLKKMLGDAPRRRDLLGARVAARDVENALEDAVSIFEAVLRAMTRRHMRENGLAEAEIETVFRKKIGNGYQNIGRSVSLCQELLGADLLGGLGQVDAAFLQAVFEKRHPITHNLGIVDRKYLDRVRSGELEGRDVPVTSEEVHQAIDLTLGLIRNLHGQLFRVDEHAGNTTA